MHLIPESGNRGLGTWPARRARINPGDVALSQGPRRVTYAELADRTARLAAGLRERGIGRGDRIAYLGPNDIATFEVCFAAGQLGAVFVPLNTRLAAPELRYMLADAGAALLVLDDGLGDLAALLRTDTGADTGTNGAVPLVLGVDELDAVVAAHQPLAEPVELGLDEPALFLYTSGTTGRPKAAVLTHASLTWNTVNQLAHVDVLGSDRALCLAPLFHAVGFGQVTLPVLFKGGQVEVVPKFDAGTVLGLVEDLGVTSFSAVPTILQLLVEHPAWDRTDLSSLRHVVYGGSPADARVVRAWQDRGVVLQQGYGMTEASPGVLMAPVAGSLAKPVSAGVPHFFTDVAHLDEDGAAVPATDTPRELLVRGPHVFAGYWNHQEESQREVVEGAWLRTGDVLRVDGDGWGFVVDRIKDVIISGAENVYPAEVEAVLLAVPGVRAAAVVAAPDARWGEVGEAFVEVAPGHDLDADTVLAFAREHLARFKVPARVHLLDALPRNATGKVLRQQLRDQVSHPRKETP